MSKLRLAIVGAGPAGIYAADILLKHERSFDVSIDLFERLPAPYGLVRYGVAPDHPRIKGIVSALRDVLDSGQIRLFGNVNFGTDITLEDLKKHYHAVIFSTGAISDQQLSLCALVCKCSEPAVLDSMTMSMIKFSWHSTELGPFYLFCRFLNLWPIN